MHELYVAHARFVANNLRRLGVPASRIEDASQEVFLVAFRRARDYDGSAASERTWLFGIVLRVAQNELRAGRRRRARVTERSESFWRDLVDVSGEPEALALAREAATLLAAALAALTEDQRRIWALTVLEAEPVPAAARTLGIKLNTAYGRLRAARAELQRVLAELGAERGL